MTGNVHSLRRPAALRRSWLFTAGLGESAHRVALRSEADVVVADLEEFTAPADRPSARLQIAALMPRCRAQDGVAAVRINRLATGGLEDLRGVMAGAPDIVFLPQVQNADEVAALAGALDQLEKTHRLSAGSTEIVPTIESARGMVAIQGILCASERVRACLLAAEDLSADLGAERGPDHLELNHLRSRFHVECQAAGRVAIDCPFNYRDAQAQIADLLWARRIGLKAKCAVFPEQVANIHAVLTPSAQQVQAAQEMVARFEAARQGEPAAEPIVQSPDYHTARRLLIRDGEFKTWNAIARS